MTRPSDLVLTLVLLVPLLAFVAEVAVVHRPRLRSANRLTAGDLRRRFGIAWERGAACSRN